MDGTGGTEQKKGARKRRKVEEVPPAPRSRIVGLRTLKLAQIDRFGFGNPKRMTAEVRASLHSSLDEFGTVLPLIARPHPSGDAERVELLDGHHRFDDFEARGDASAEVLVVDVPDDKKARALLLALKGIQADFNPEVLPAYVESLMTDTGATEEWLAGVTAVDLSFLHTTESTPDAGGPSPDDNLSPDDGRKNLGGIAERFLFPPFTVLDGRSGPWRARKQAWLALKIKSPEMRSGSAAGASAQAGVPKSGAWINHRSDGTTEFAGDKWKKGASAPKGLALKDVAGYVPGFYKLKTAREEQLGRKLSKSEFEKEHLPAILAARAADGNNLSTTGTSGFDPVLCELAVRWFCPPGGRMVEPYSGTSTLGNVAAILGREYVGIELQKKQVEANGAQWLAIESTIRGGSLPYKITSPRWVCGDATNPSAVADGTFDFLFSCPPYAHLERYSDDPRDISTMNYQGFLAAYRKAIAELVKMLREDRFIAWLVGDVRDARGMYLGFVADTIGAFRAAGAELYNEAILVTPAGSLPVRVGRQFAAGRKFGKTHQNLLIFVKGDPRRATAACGEVEVGEIPFGEEITEEEEVVSDEPERTDPEASPEAPPAEA